MNLVLYDIHASDSFLGNWSGCHRAGNMDSCGRTGRSGTVQSPGTYCHGPVLPPDECISGHHCGGRDPGVWNCGNSRDKCPECLLSGLCKYQEC